MTENPSVSLIIPVYNAEPYLRESVGAALEAVRAYPDAELVIVDNGSSDGSPALIEALVGDEAVVDRMADVNVGAVRNRGAELARGEVLAFIDADCVIPTDYVRTAVSVLQTTGAAATGSPYVLPESPVWVESVWDALHVPAADGPVGYINSGNLVCLRSAFDSVGGFDAELESGEDAELGSRMRAGGFEIHQAAVVRAVHLGNPKTLRGFFRKQVWHGMGALGTFRQEPLDKPLLLTLVHAAGTLVGLGLLVSQPRPFSILLLLALTLFAPLLAVAYRVSANGRLRGVPGGTILYWVYFTARSVSLLKLARDRLVRPRGSTK